MSQTVRDYANQISDCVPKWECDNFNLKHGAV